MGGGVPWYTGFTASQAMAGMESWASAAMMSNVLGKRPGGVLFIRATLLLATPIPVEEST
jgi:hypothetical protein